MPKPLKARRRRRRKGKTGRLKRAAVAGAAAIAIAVPTKAQARKAFEGKPAAQRKPGTELQSEKEPPLTKRNYRKLFSTKIKPQKLVKPPSAPKLLNIKTLSLKELEDYSRTLEDYVMYELGWANVLVGNLERLRLEAKNMWEGEPGRLVSAAEIKKEIAETKSRLDRVDRIVEIYTDALNTATARRKELKLPQKKAVAGKKHK